MAQQPAANAAYYAQPPPDYVEGSKPIYPSAPQEQQYPAYQPAPQYPQQPPAEQHTIVVQQPATTTVIVAATHFGPDPVIMQCHYCQQTVTTSLSYEIGGLTWLICGLLTLFGFLLCAWIPCCIDSARDVVHNCPNCKKRLGKYSRL